MGGMTHLRIVTSGGVGSGLRTNSARMEIANIHRMTSATLRSAWKTVPTTFSLFLGGGIVGAELAHRLAPGSMFASFLSLMTLPLAFAAGMYKWLGFAVVSAVLEWFDRLARAAFFTNAPRQTGSEAVPPGTIAFIPAALAATGGCGVIVGMVGSTSFFDAIGIYLVVGLIYGVLCWSLARKGFIPFPEPE